MSTVDSIEATLDRLVKRLANRARALERPDDDAVVAACEELDRRRYEPRDRKGFRHLAEYMAARLTEASTKGLVLAGAAGTGKTLFLTRVLRLRPKTAAELVTLQREIGWGPAWNERVYGEYHDASVSIPPQDLAIDDLGQEPTAVTYGLREEVLERVLCDRYRHWQEFAARTYITSNLTAAELDRRYGRRITDRLNEMCTWITLRGPSARNG